MRQSGIGHWTNSMKKRLGSAILTQLIATGGALVLMNQVGLIDGWFAPNMARLTQTNSTLTLTASQASWLASWLKLGRFTSVVLVPIFIEVAGSRKAVVYTFVPIAVSWALTIVAKSAICHYIARFFSGIAIGLTFGTYSIYLGEISAPTLRGTFNSITMIGWPLGNVVGTVAENYLREEVSCAIYLALCFMGMFLFAWLPESPYQLVKNGDPTKARESLEWYRGHKSTETEMAEIMEFVESTRRVGVAETMRQLASRPILKAVVLVTLIFTYPQLTGVFNVIFYMQIILSNGVSHARSPSEMVIFTNLALLVVNVIAFNLVDKLGRRIVLIVSSSLMTIALIGLGLHFYTLKTHSMDSVRTDALPIAAITVLLASYSIGFSPVMGTLLGEMFPTSIKSSAATIVTFVSSLAGFATTKSYEPLVSAIGECYVFWIYATFAASAIPVVMLFLPETKGKTFQEIQNILNKR